MLAVFLQQHGDTGAARAFFGRLLGEPSVPEIHKTDILWSSGEALREPPMLHVVEHVQVVSTARCNNPIEKSHRLTRRRIRQQ